jgi:hypothetical protein
MGNISFLCSAIRFFMKCFFLSADGDPQAWAQTQESFLNHAPAHWEIEFFQLNPKKDLVAVWRDLVLGQQSLGQPFMVATPGVRFGQHTCTTLDNSVAHLEKSGGFDLLFSDLRLLQAGAMADLFVLRRQLAEHGRTRLIDPRPLFFEGPGACIIHPRACAQVGALASAASLRELIEGALCQPVREGGLMARFVFPFATTVSSGEDGIVPPEPEARSAAIGDIYRRMVWRDGGCEPELAPLAQMSKGLSTEAKAFAILWAAMAD